MKFRSIINLGIFFVLGLALASTAYATKLYKPQPEFILEGLNAQPWERIERHVDPHPRFPFEPFHEKLVQCNAQVIEAFGTKEPHSSKFLLHVMPGWDKATKSVPVILLPGANDDATRRYAYPLSSSHPDVLKRTGLAVHLAKQGFAVFAITWSHFHGCNLHQGEHIANAITRIKTMLNREDDESFKVDLVTYSKGAMAARCYVQNGSDFSSYKYMTKFRNDVRHIMFQVAPIGGLDTPFRYYLYNLSCKTQKVPAPLGVTSQKIYGLWKDSGVQDIHSGYWTGQLQMIEDTRKVGVAYGPLSWTADANLTMNAIRDGGKSFAVKSHGLDAARLAGGNLIENLNKRGLPKNVSATLVAGTHQTLYNEYLPTLQIPIGAELSDKSDGLVFLKSATYTKGLSAQGAEVSVKTFDYNHVEISRHDDVYKFVTGVLARNQ
jgi:hypothetical protein